MTWRAFALGVLTWAAVWPSAASARETNPNWEISERFLAAVFAGGAPAAGIIYQRQETGKGWVSITPLRFGQMVKGCRSERYGYLIFADMQPQFHGVSFKLTCPKERGLPAERQVAVALDRGRIVRVTLELGPPAPTFALPSGGSGN